MSDALEDLISSHIEKKEPESNLITSCETIKIVSEVQKLMDVQR